MRKILSTCLLLFFGCTLHAQVADSGFINLGRTQLRKDFVQGVTINAKDLEKLPFTSLSEVVNVWLDGSYTHSNNVVYVVDGVLLADPNIYNIHDIEELTMVENAEAQVNGAYNQRMLIVIRTKRATKEGLDFAVSGQSHMVQEKPYGNTGLESEHNFFHQYGVSALAKTKSINAGASISYLQDVLPHLKNDALVTKTATNLDRFRLNSFIGFSIDPKNLVTAKLGLVTQPSHAGYTITLPSPGSTSQRTADYKGRENLVHAELGYQARFSHFTNNFVAGYQGYIRDSVFQSIFSTTPNPTTIENQSHDKANHLLFQNTFSYSLKTGAIELLTALNASYRRNQFVNESNSSSFQPPNVLPLNSSSYVQEGKKFLLTPSFDLGYNHAINLHAGILMDLSKNKQNTTYPFVSATADLLRLFGSSSANKLNIFASYATTDYFFDVQYRLSDYDYPPSAEIPPFSFGQPVYISTNPDRDYSNLQAGSMLNLSAQKLSISYNYERRDYISFIIFPVPPGGSGGYGFALSEVLANAHRIYIQWKAIDKSNISWYTGLHSTSIKNHLGIPMQNSTSHDLNGDFNDESRSWTGGWNNRLELKNFTFGADLGYHFGKHDHTLTGSNTYNLFALQYIYAGYKTSLKKNHPLEIYLSSRNPVMNNDYRLFNDNRQYFGAGINLGW